MIQKDEYSTTDIVLASALRVHNYKMIRIDIVGNRGTFVFADVDQSFLFEYDLGKCLVEPTSFNANIKQLTTSVRRMGQTRQ